MVSLKIQKGRTLRLCRPALSEMGRFPDSEGCTEADGEDLASRIILVEVVERDDGVTGDRPAIIQVPFCFNTSGGDRFEVVAAFMGAVDPEVKRLATKLRRLS